MHEYKEWCQQHGVEHAHCPDYCEHPQPFMLDGVLVCGRCAIKYGEIVPMIPCTPEVCR